MGTHRKSYIPNVVIKKIILKWIYFICEINRYSFWSQEKTVAGWGHDDAMRSTDGLLALLWVFIAIAVTARTPRAAAATCPQPSDAVRRCKCSSRDNEIQIWWVFATLSKFSSVVQTVYMVQGMCTAGIGREEG